VERLDDASASFFAFFRHDDIFMAWAMGDFCSSVCGNGGCACQLIKAWAAIARAGPRAFAINVGAEAQARRVSQRTTRELLRRH
jgi:hypothetical protein